MAAQNDSYGPDFSQAPTDKLDYTFDWKGAGWLQSGDTIADSTFEVVAISGTPTAPTINDPVDVNTENDATCWFTGGDAGADYVLRNQITTAAGRKRTKSIKIRVRDNH